MVALQRNELTLLLEAQQTLDDLFRTFIVGFILTSITFGIFRSWYKVKKLKFLYGNTEVLTQNDSRFRIHFNGTGGKLFVINVVGIILMPLMHRG